MPFNISQRNVFVGNDHWPRHARDTHIKKTQNRGGFSQIAMIAESTSVSFTPAPALAASSAGEFERAAHQTKAHLFSDDRISFAFVLTGIEYLAGWLKQVRMRPRGLSTSSATQSIQRVWKMAGISGSTVLGAARRSISQLERCESKAWTRRISIRSQRSFRPAIRCQRTSTPARVCACAEGNGAGS